MFNLFSLGVENVRSARNIEGDEDLKRGDRGQPLTTDIGSRAVLWGVGILEDAGRIIGFKSPVVRATIDKYTEEIAVDSRRIQTELGFKPQFDLKSGWEETVNEMRRMGYL